MGQQQLLLLVLSAIIVGIAIVVGINMFGAGAYQANREAVIQDAVTIAAKAQEWYRKPAVLGGGNRSFLGLNNLQVIGFPASTTNGTYSILGAAGSATITATGRESNAAGDTLSLTINVFPDSVGTPNITSGT